ENPFAIQHELQELMQSEVGSVRVEEEMEGALVKIADLGRRAADVAPPGNREYNPGWHTAIDLKNLLTVAEAITRSAISRKESRGAHARLDYQDKVAEYGKVNTIIRRGPDGEMLLEQRPVTPV